MDELIDVSIVGEPVVYGAGLFALLIVVFATALASPIVSVAHEGGHMVMAVLTFRGFSSWRYTDKGTETRGVKTGWGPGLLLTLVAGFLTPPLLGVAGAAVLAGGNAWGVLVVAAILLFGAFLYAGEVSANIFTALLLGAVLLVLWRGSSLLQLTVAAGIVWLLLLGGVYQAVRMSRAEKTCAAQMARATLIPTIVWQGFWLAVALVSLYAGARLLFVGDGWPDGVWPFDERV
ncbi:M50 family metallopeptidase [Actinomycetospora atypica]|uniref:M50 family metallopeptidase n=1 Tax=Actinomycetospora atypica TaxID=1290095 RepID=A0ABV9YTQ2_9PSEU